MGILLSLFGAGSPKPQSTVDSPTELNGQFNINAIHSYSRSATGLPALEINRELATPPIQAPDLNPDLFKPNQVEWDFLKRAISNDEAVLRERVYAVQKES